MIYSAYDGTCQGYSADAPVSHAACDKTYQEIVSTSLNLNDT